MVLRAPSASTATTSRARSRAASTWIARHADPQRRLGRLRHATTRSSFLNEDPVRRHGGDDRPADARTSPAALARDARRSTACARRRSALQRARSTISGETQRADGSWWGRWGVNYIYGTWSALPALAPLATTCATPRIRRAVRWLEDASERRRRLGRDLRLVRRRRARAAAARARRRRPPGRCSGCSRGRSARRRRCAAASRT